ncbi:MAG: glycoside hydrolase family 43 protein [Bacteroidetes bacterium]|nr:glycoside hydrolase family 43 protein [Bacteroidota bacterium]
MRTGFLFILLFSLFSCNSTIKEAEEFANPILAGFYPDPSICRVGDDFYLVNSTFSYFPGIPVFHSRDLVNWKLIGHVMDRAEQLDLEGQGVSRGIFAPAIRYNKGVFYVTCTLVDIGGNFVATAENPKGPWSNPVWIPEIDGIDPSMFFDENGKAYILYNSIPPDNKPLYDGHRTLRMYEFDVQNKKVLGEEKIIVNGGVDITKKPVWIEGPHIFQKDGYYYLIAAEGGTAEQHSEVVFRSREVDGPYEPYSNNPILTQRHLDPKRENPVTSTGHADFVQTESGEWWAVFLGCRPYENDYFNTGRETFMVPVTWKDGWPIINFGKDEVQYHYPLPAGASLKTSALKFSGNMKIRDDFQDGELNKNWMFLRTPKTQWYDLKKKPGFLSMQLRPESCSGTGNPSFIGHRQQNLKGEASIAMNFLPADENEKAGLLIFQNENHFYFLCQSLRGSESIIQLFKSSSSTGSMELLAAEIINKDQSDKELFLKIEAKGSIYSFSFGFEPEQWSLLKDSVDAKYLSTKAAGGFVGCIYALYATSLGKPCDTEAYFDWFQYTGNDDIYKRTGAKDDNK